MMFFNYLIYFLQKRLWIYFEITRFVKYTGAEQNLKIQTQSFLAMLQIVKVRNFGVWRNI